MNFYYDEVKDANLIGAATIATLAPKSVGKASVKWESPIVGKHTLIAAVDTPEGDANVDNQFSKSLTIKEALGLKVMIDASHKNENTSTDTGTYKNNFTAFTKLVQQEGYTVVENISPLTAELLKDVKVLVLTHPNVDLTEEENQAVCDFVKNGGSLLLTDKSNYKNDPTINNDLLTEMGSTIQLNHDGINDDTPEGNFWSDPLKSKFAVRLHLKPVSNYLTDRATTIDYYSGASLEKVGHEPLTDSDSVTILASGNETTYQGAVSADFHVYDDVSDDHGGSAIPVIASEVIGEGKIIVSGMNFMNDKQLDESYDPKGNDELALNAVNWLADRGTVVKGIGEVRNLPDDTSVVAEGIVTTGAGTFYDAFYLQDQTGGIMAFHDVPDGALEVGDKVRVYGHIKTYENNTELEYNDFSQDVSFKIGHVAPIEPKTVTTQGATAEENQGLLVKITGKVKQKYDDNSYIINDGTGEVLVFTDGYIAAKTGAVPALNIGDTLEAVGLTGKYANGNRIRVRDTKELKKTESSQPAEEQSSGGGSTSQEPSTPTLPKVDNNGGMVFKDDVISNNNGKTQVDEKKMVDAINSSKDKIKTMQIQIKGDTSKISVPVNALKTLKDNNNEAVLEINNESASYKLPMKELILKGNVSNVEILVQKVEIPKELKDKQVTTVAPVIEFTVNMTIDGKEVKLDQFNHYVSREIVMDKPFNKNKAVAVRINKDGSLTVIPTVFDGNTAIIKSMTNSMYTIIEMDKTFQDVNNGASWAETFIEKLASKGIIYGKSETKYEPNASMTRGQFAALISRGLALTPKETWTGPFKDVTESSSHQ